MDNWKLGEEMKKCQELYNDSGCLICFCGKCCLNCAKASGDADKCERITILRPGVCNYRRYALKENMESEVREHGEDVRASYEWLV